jgi:hypothetical protein
MGASMKFPFIPPIVYQLGPFQNKPLPKTTGFRTGLLDSEGKSLVQSGTLDLYSKMA